MISLEFLSVSVIERATDMHPHGEKPNTCLSHGRLSSNATCLTLLNMKAAKKKCNRVIGLDMHPDVFAAAALPVPKLPSIEQPPEWIQDRIATLSIETWASKHLRPGDTLVLEASGNSFEVARRFQNLGYTCLVLESCQASKVKENYCNDDRHSALKLARVYLSGLAKIVWQPDDQTRLMREVFFAHRNSVKDCTRLRNRIRTFLNEHCVRLPQGTSLIRESGLSKALSLHPWTSLQTALIEGMFNQLWQSEARRKRFEEIMVEELLKQPQWSQLWRLMGVRHRVAFGLMAMIGNIHRFPTAKKLVGYLGLAPGKVQSGNNVQGYNLGIGKKGRGDLRALLIQSAQNALNQRKSPLHRWGRKLEIKKNRNIAAAAVARKLAISIWHVLKGHYTPLLELYSHLETKLEKLATLLGGEKIQALGYANRTEFKQNYFKEIQQNT